MCLFHFSFLWMSGCSTFTCAKNKGLIYRFFYVPLFSTFVHVTSRFYYSLPFLNPTFLADMQDIELSHLLRETFFFFFLFPSVAFSLRTSTLGFKWSVFHNFFYFNFIFMYFVSLILHTVLFSIWHTKLKLLHITTHFTCGFWAIYIMKHSLFLWETNSWNKRLCKTGNFVVGNATVSLGVAKFALANCWAEIRRQ